MKKTKTTGYFLSILLIASMILTACGGGAQATEPGGLPEPGQRLQW
jgi:hypothetical protein